MTKAQLRELYKNKRAGIPALEKIKLADLLLINFQKIRLPFISYLHTYRAMPGQHEIDTGPFVRYLGFRNPGLLVSLPKINRQTGKMEHYIYNEDTVLKKNKFGIEEPEGGDKLDPLLIDLVLTPLLAFDNKGYRVGFGKGFYDRFFTECRPDVIKAGLSFFEAGDSIEDTEPHDVPLNYCITPRTVYRF